MCLTLPGPKAFQSRLKLEQHVIVVHSYSGIDCHQLAGVVYHRRDVLQDWCPGPHSERGLDVKASDSATQQHVTYRDLACIMITSAATLQKSTLLGKRSKTLCRETQSSWCYMHLSVWFAAVRAQREAHVAGI